MGDRRLRALHFSDVHVDVSPWRIPLWSWFGKRLVGGGNHVLRRAPKFRQARRKLTALSQFRQAEAVDLVLCTGDYTILGTEPEMAAARLAVDGLTQAPHYLTTPGNHDLYLHDSVRRQRFERSFGEFLESDLPELRAPGSRWPVVRLIDSRVAVVAVNSARPNPPVWRSTGKIGEAQLEALGRILADPRLEGRFVFVMTHYAPRRADGSPDTPLHRLLDADAFLEVCHPVERGTILHGHLHRCFRLEVDGLRIPIHGAGSTTQERREGFWLFEVGDDGGEARRGYWDGQRYRLTDERYPLP